MYRMERAEFNTQILEARILAQKQLNDKLKRELQGTVDEPDSKLGLLGKAVDGLMNILRITETFGRMDHSVVSTNRHINTHSFQVNEIVSNSRAPTPANKEAADRRLAVEDAKGQTTGPVTKNIRAMDSNVEVSQSRIF